MRAAAVPVFVRDLSPRPRAAETKPKGVAAAAVFFFFLWAGAFVSDFYALANTAEQDSQARPGVPAAVAGVAGVALVTFVLAAYRRSDAAVRQLVSDHRESIRAAAARYDVDPRLIASIVYVTHRDNLFPFRGALERLVVTAWARNLRGEFGIGPPDRMDEVGTDENPLLNRALDISVGLAQIKPRTAQTAIVLAMGRRPDDLLKPLFFSYRDTDPVGEGWTLPITARISAIAPIPILAEKHVVASALLDAKSNIATCALILALYQNQWEAANRDWSLRKRPDILATLYQIGFARSRPHGAPRSSTFGTRVRQVYDQPWLEGLLTAPLMQRNSDLERWAGACGFSLQGFSFAGGKGFSNLASSMDVFWRISS